MPRRPAPDVDVETVAAGAEELRAAGRAAMGVTGETGQVPPLRKILRSRGVGWYPLIALSLLVIADQFQSYGFTVLAPEISATLGISKGAIAAALAVKTLAIALAPLPMAALVQRRARRAVLSVATGVAWSVFAIGTGFVISAAGLLAVLSADGLSSGSISGLHTPLLVDIYPPEARVRVLSYYTSAGSAASVAAPLLVALVAGVLGFTWRGVFAVAGLVSLACALGAFRLRDPGFGRWDTQKLRDMARRHEDETLSVAPPSSDLAEAEVSLGFFEIVRRLLLIPTVRRLMIANAVFGVLLIPFQTFLIFFLQERWGLGPGGRGVFLAFTAGVSVVALLIFGRPGERAFRRDPGRIMRLGGYLQALAVVLICLAALSPWFWGMVALFALAFAALAILTPALAVGVLSVIPAEMRPHASALSYIFLGGVGGLLGAFFLNGIDNHFGIVGTIISLIIPGVIGSLVLASTGGLIVADIDRMIGEVIEDTEIQEITRSGGHLPMLACRGIDFSYGQVQVLFDVDLTVDDGEMVALLGTNGAGKSTLLRVISGIGLPTSGSVRYRGAEITYIDAERRVRLGITQIPGGRAVFGPMSVVNNMRSFAYTLGADRRAVDRRIDASFAAFPRLAQRRNQAASTLSGGEQQMLALSKALILKPRLLLIDELSLGLAPIVVGQLLDMVRQINAEGTAVVLVEQSVNIALELVDHAYFMEKGEMRFDGPASGLLARDDLLRAVFLEGTAKGSGR